MDELLKHEPLQLADERMAMFALVDRFSSAIEAYKKQYTSTVEKKNKDLQHRSSEKQETLKKMNESQEKERRKALNEHESAVRAIDRQIGACKNQSSEALHEQENRLEKAERAEKASLSNAHNADEEKIKKNKVAFLNPLLCITAQFQPSPAVVT